MTSPYELDPKPKKLTISTFFSNGSRACPKRKIQPARDVWSILFFLLDNLRRDLDFPLFHPGTNVGRRPGGMQNTSLSE
jgi:hypothetical protein